MLDPGSNGVLLGAVEGDLGDVDGSDPPALPGEPDGVGALPTPQVKGASRCQLGRLPTRTVLGSSLQTRPARL